MKTQSHLLNILLFSIFSFGNSIQVSSQKVESNQINKFSTEQGLSSNTVHSILQDQKGFIWIATEDGLNKFDGKNFTHFSVNSGRYGLSHNRTQALLLAPDGNIWAGTSDGLNIYDYKADSIIKVRNNTSPLRLIYNDITSLTLSADKSTTWIGTYGDGINYFDWKQKKFFALRLPKIGHDAPLLVMSLLEDDNKRLWIGTQNDGLFMYELATKRLTHYPLPDNALFIRTIFQDSFHRIWFGTTKGIYLYNETTCSLEIVNYPTPLSTISIGAIAEDHSGNLWIGTEGFLMHFSVRSFSMNSNFPYQINSYGESAEQLNCPSINSLFTDQDNNVWIGTAWGGVNMLKGTSNKFKLLKHDSSLRSTLPASPITALCSDGGENLYIGTMGTDKFGSCSLNVITGKIIFFSFEKKIPGLIYQAVFLDSNQNLWFGTYNNGLIETNKEGSKFVHFVSDPKNQNSLLENDVRCISQSSDGSIWIGTSGGLCKIEQNQHLVTRINRINIRCIKESKNGTLWLGTYGSGVITYSPKTNQINSHPTIFSPHIISDILIVGDSIWLATPGEGLMVYNQLKKTGKIYTTSNGFISNYINSLENDNNGRIWIGTPKGISKLNPETNEIENFNVQDGIQPREFSERSSTKFAGGLLAFGGFGGLNIFDPLSVTKNDKCPPVIFTKLFVFNDLITPSENKHHPSPLKENISLANQMVLNYNQSVFTIEFVGINYNANQKIQYAYFLEGSDKKWNHIGFQNNVTFRNLQPGRYIFKVKASSPDAVWSDANIASIIIIIRPPWWATWWAYLIYFIILSVIIYFVWVFFTLRIRTANDIKIERAKREKDEELHQEKLQFFTNISHEFRTPLTLIIGPLENMISEENNEGKKVHLNLVLKNAKRMLLMVNQLLDFRKAERGQLKLRVQYADLKQTLSDVISSFNELKVKKNIHLTLDCPEEATRGWFDPDVLSKCIFNLLSNSFKYTPRDGEIILSVKISNNFSTLHQVQISVSDNGSGITSSNIDRIFDRFYQVKDHKSISSGSGIGLHFTKTLVELHHGLIEVSSIPDIKTTFTITFPVNKEAYNDFEVAVDSVESSNENPGNETVDILFAEDLPDNNERHGKKRSSNTKRILIVEDNSDIRSYISEILGKEYAIDERENGLEALDALNEKEYDLIISDIMMPEMDGIELCKKLKSSIETDHIPIILLTAKSEIENKIEGLKTGADSYITKPFHPDHLRVRVAKLIELREILKDRYGKKISLGDIQQKTENDVSQDELFLQKTVSVILEKMIDSEFNGDYLASELCISRMGLHRKIKALTGQSTGEFIRNIRLKKACEYLSTPGKNISEVCYDVGFNSPSYFTTCFADVYKMTPSDYAKKMRIKI